MNQNIPPAEYANLPAGAPPPGIQTNFLNPPSRAYEAHIGMGICIGISSVFLGLRIYVKSTISRNWHIEDCKSVEPYEKIQSSYEVRELLVGICTALLGHEYTPQADVLLQKVLILVHDILSFICKYTSLAIFDRR